MLKAIETKYKNTKFKSRLEAKWAVFFDEVGLDWLYEYQGFETGSGWYLPDFYLPELKYYIEIKPSIAIYDISDVEPEHLGEVEK